jgi:hypothetical protein
VIVGLDRGKICFSELTSGHSPLQNEIVIHLVDTSTLLDLSLGYARRNSITVGRIRWVLSPMLDFSIRLQVHSFDRSDRFFVQHVENDLKT